MTIVPALLLLFQSQPALPESSELVEQTQSASEPAPETRIEKLDRLLRERNYSQINEVLNSASDREAVDLDLLWLRDNSMTGKSAFTPMTYATMLWSTAGQQGGNDPQLDSIRETAAVMLLFTLIVFDIDGARCADRSAPSDRMHKILSSRFDILTFAQKRDETAKKLLTDLVLKLDERTQLMRENDFDSEFLCTGGLQHMMHSMQTGTATERAPRKGEFGRQIELSDGEEKYVPQLVDKEEWIKKAAEKRAKLRQSVESLLNAPSR